jgi:hypothetical protein
MKNLNYFKKLIKVASKLEAAKQYSFADKILIKIAQETPEVFKQGTEMKPGTSYEVQGQKSQLDIISQVATSGIPARASIDGVDTLVTHGSSDGNFWLLPDSQAQLFYSNNPDFKTSNLIADMDKNAGIQAVIDNGKLWISAQGMSKYAGAKWIACNNLNNGANFGQIGGAKGIINVGTQETPEGEKLYLSTDK